MGTQPPLWAPWVRAGRFGHEPGGQRRLPKCLPWPPALTSATGCGPRPGRTGQRARARGSSTTGQPGARSHPCPAEKLPPGAPRHWGPPRPLQPHRELRAPQGCRHQRVKEALLDPRPRRGVQHLIPCPSPAPLRHLLQPARELAAGRRCGRLDSGPSCMWKSSESLEVLTGAESTAGAPLRRVPWPPVTTAAGTPGAGPAPARPLLPHSRAPVPAVQPGQRGAVPAPLRTSKAPSRGG